MPKKTTTERVQAYRARLKEDEQKLLSYRIKDKQRKRDSRKNEVITPEEKEFKKKCVRLRVQEHRARAKLQKTTGTTNVQTENPFATPQSFGKAVKRADLGLPKSPRKRRVVISKLAERHLGAKNSRKVAAKTAITEEVKDAVIAFYKRDDISRPTPGIKEYVSIKVDGEKKKIQKRYLNMTVYEAYKCFCAENSELKIGKSKFHALRPPEVLLRGNTPKNVCLCRFHENMSLQFGALTSKVAHLPKDLETFINGGVCNAKNPACMLGKCSVCKEVKLFANILLVDEETANSNVEWYRWEKVEGKIDKVVKDGTVQDLIDEILADLPKFLEHSFIKVEQAKIFKSTKEELKANEAVLQMDFAENYTAEFQDDVQSNYWNRRQITIFTAVLWTKDNVESFAFVSECLDHGKNSVCTFIDNLMNHIQSKYPGINTLNIFSDGAASQFKNKYIFKYLCHIQKARNIQVSWNFFATSHGKGAVDGIGGSIKRLVSDNVNSRKYIVKDASSFVTCAAQNTDKINVVHVTQTEIDNHQKFLDILWTDVQTVDGTQGFHFVSPCGISSVMCKSFSICEDYEVHSLGGEDDNVAGTSSVSESLSTPVERSVTVGSFVLVKFPTKTKDKYFVGQVTEIDMDCQVKFMRKQGQDRIFAFKDNDSGWIDQRDIVKVFEEPQVDNRCHYHFTEHIEIAE